MNRILGAAIAAVLAMVPPAGLAAHEGHAHKVMGTVAAVDAKHIEVDTREGRKESFVLTAETKYLKGKTVVSAADVKVGARVVLSVVEKDGRKSVTEVLMADTAAGSPDKH